METTAQPETSRLTGKTSIESILVNDVEELQYTVAPWQLRMNQISPGNLRATFSVVQVAGILLTHEKWSQRVASSGVTPVGYVAFAAPCSGAGFDWCRFRTGPHQLAFAPTSTETDFVTEQREDHWVMLIPHSLLNDFLGAELAADLLPDTRLITGDPRPLDEFCSQVLGTIALLEARGSGQDTNKNEAIILRNRLLLCAFRALSGHNGATSKNEQFTRRFLAYRKARAFIETDTADMEIEQIAKNAGASRRSLENGFRESMAISPQRFARCIRLNRLHRLLLLASPQELTVTIAEQSLGLLEFGRTAGYYRELFNELPSETLHREPPRAGIRLIDTLH